MQRFTRAFASNPSSESPGKAAVGAPPPNHAKEKVGPSAAQPHHRHSTSTSTTVPTKNVTGMKPHGAPGVVAEYPNSPSRMPRARVSGPPPLGAGAPHAPTPHMPRHMAQQSNHTQAHSMPLQSSHHGQHQQQRPQPLPTQPQPHPGPNQALRGPHPNPGPQNPNPAQNPSHVQNHPNYVQNPAHPQSHAQNQHHAHRPPQRPAPVHHQNPRSAPNPLPQRQPLNAPIVPPHLQQQQHVPHPRQPVPPPQHPPPTRLPPPQHPANSTPLRPSGPVVTPSHPTPRAGAPMATTHSSPVRPPRRAVDTSTPLHHVPGPNAVRDLPNNNQLDKSLHVGQVFDQGQTEANDQHQASGLDWQLNRSWMSRAGTTALPSPNKSPAVAHINQSPRATQPFKASAPLQPPHHLQHGPTRPMAQPAPNHRLPLELPVFVSKPPSPTKQRSAHPPVNAMHVGPPMVIEIVHTSRPMPPPKQRRQESYKGSAKAAVHKPRAVDDTTGSRVRVILGPTGQSFLLLLHEDNGQHQWQNRSWRNVPFGLDQRLRTVDYVHQCAFTEHEWFLSARNKVTGITETWWEVQSLAFHEALETATAPGILVRVVFGDMAIGQFIILLGLDGYTLGENIPESLQNILERINSTESAVARIRGLNASGRFLLEEAVAGGQVDTENTSRNTHSVFHSEGVSPHLLEELTLTATASQKAACDLIDIALGSNDKAWLVVRHETYDGSAGVHQEVISRLDAFYARFRQRRVKVQAQTQTAQSLPDQSDDAPIAEMTHKSAIEAREADIDVPASDEVIVSTPSDEVEEEIIVPPTETEDIATNLEEPDIEVHAEGEDVDKSAPIEESAMPTYDEMFDTSKSYFANVPSVSKAERRPKAVQENYVEAMDEASLERWKKYESASIQATKKKRNKEDRFKELERKCLSIGDKVTVCGKSAELGDGFILDIERETGFVVVNLPYQGSEDDAALKRSGIASTVEDPRKLLGFVREDGYYERNEVFLLALAQDKYEAAVLLHHNQCPIGSCACKRDFFGYSQQMQQPNHWKVGDRVNVIGYANGVVIEPKEKYTNKPNLVHVQYDDGATYHVSQDLVRPEKRFVSPGQCSFQLSMKPEEDAIRIRSVVESRASPPEFQPFMENVCSEKIDLRRLQRLAANFRSDCVERRQYMDELAIQLEKQPDNHTFDYAYRKLVHSYDLEETVFMLYEVMKHQSKDPDGCIVHEVQYRHKDSGCRGRLFSIGRQVRVLGWKFPRTLTLQGVQAELHAPLTGAFAHYVDCENSDVRLLCSLAKQVGCDDIIPTLKKYRDFRSKLLPVMQFEQSGISEVELKRLPNFILFGGTYDSWLRAVEENQVSPQVKQFAFLLYTEIRAVRDQLLAHPRFQWTLVERDNHEKLGLKKEAIDIALLTTILQASENEVQRIIHRTFHNRGWIVRAKLFDSILVERGAKGRTEKSSVDDMMRLAERTCEAQGWGIELTEKALYGRQNDPLATLTEARDILRERRMEATFGHGPSDTQF